MVDERKGKQFYGSVKVYIVLTVYIKTINLGSI